MRRTILPMMSSRRQKARRRAEAYLNSIQIASMAGLREGILSFGPANTTVLVFQGLLDSKALWLTGNSTSVYFAAWMDLGDEPMVIETPPNVLGIVDDHWFLYVTDFGNAGPDKGQGGKYLIVPAGFEGDLPAHGYHVVRTNTFGNWVMWRGFQVVDDPKPAVAATKESFRMYPLSQADSPPEMNFVDISGLPNSTIHRSDHHIFEETDAVVQAEPSAGQNPELLGRFASIGIKKGKAFEPDARMQKILAPIATGRTARSLN